MPVLLHRELSVDTRAPGGIDLLEDVMDKRDVSEIAVEDTNYFIEYRDGGLTLRWDVIGLTLRWDVIGWW